MPKTGFQENNASSITKFNASPKRFIFYNNKFSPCPPDPQINTEKEILIFTIQLTKQLDKKKTFDFFFCSMYISRNINTHITVYTHTL